MGKSQGRINKARQDAEVIINNANAYASRVIGQGLSKAGAIRAKMQQQSPNLNAFRNSLGLNAKQLAAYYFFDTLDPSKYGQSHINMQLPKSVECLTDPSKC